MQAAFEGSRTALTSFFSSVFRPNERLFNLIEIKHVYIRWKVLAGSQGD